MRLCLFIASIFFAVHVNAQTQIRQMEGVIEYRLSNGLQVLLAPNDLQPRTYVNLIVKAGSAVEGFGEGGMAHLLEHMVFKGTPTTRDAMKAFEERSLNFNGTTNSDRTNYFASMNPGKDNLHWYIGWLADASANSFIAKADLDKEMSVVRNEFERGDSSPMNAVYHARFALAFPNHGYGRPTIGNRSDIENVNIERLQAFYKTWYRPSNMVLIVTGRFEATSTLAHIQASFGVLNNPSQPIPKIYTREPVQDGMREAVIRRVGGEPQLLLGWRGAPRAHRDDAVLDVIASSLGDNASGRFKLDVDKQRLGTGVSVSHGSMTQYGTFDVSLQLASPDKADAAQKLLLGHIADIARTGVTTQELQRARTQALRDHEDSKRSAESFGRSLGESAAAGDWRLGFWYRDNASSITIEDTQRAAKSYLLEANRVRVVYVPDPSPMRASDPLPVALEAYVAKATVRADADQFPALARFDATAAEIDQRTVRSVLPVGTRLALLARPAVGDAIQGTLRIHWGSAESMRGRGVTSFMAGLLQKGSLTRSERQIQDTLNDLQSSLNLSSNAHGLTVSFKTTRQNWPAFATLMTDVLRHPAFKEDDFKVWQDLQIAALTNGRDQPEVLASQALARAMNRYDAADPRYAPSNDEAIAQWKALRVQDVRSFWQQFAGASVSEFAAVGALDVAAVQKSVAVMLDGWQTPGGASAYQRIASPLQSYTPTRIVIATPDKPNAGLRLSHRFAAEPYSREGLALQTANGIIGSSSASRIYTRLRKEEGLTYGTYSWTGASEDDKVGSFNIAGSYAPQNRDRFEFALAEVLQEIQSKGLLAEELVIAKRVAAERVKSSRDNDNSLASALANNEWKTREGTLRNFAWWDGINAVLQSLTLEEVNSAAKKLANLSNAVTVITGDFK